MRSPLCREMAHYAALMRPTLAWFAASDSDVSDEERRVGFGCNALGTYP